MNKIENDLSSYASLWSLPDHRILGSRPIPGLKTGQTIWLNNACLPERPDWQYKVYENGGEVCCNRHFKTADEAFGAAYKWLAGPMQLSVREFESDGLFEGFTVDGLLSGYEVYIVEVQPGEWLLEETHLGGLLSKWKGRFSNPKEALAAYKALVN